MTLTKRTQRNLLGALVTSAIFLSSSAQADEYRDARAELVAAYQVSDYPAMQIAATKALAARPGFPGALFNLALAQTLGGNHSASLQTLENLLSKGVDFGAADLDEFTAVRDLDAWTSYQEEIENLYEPSGIAEPAFTHDDSSFVPEGIALDADGNLFLGSIRKGRIVQLGPDSKIVTDRQQHWSVFGMRFHPDGSLWFASAAVPQLADVGADQGKSGLFRLDVSTGEISKAAVLPQEDAAQVLGDLIIADDNTIYATDSLTGAIYRYYIDSNEFETLLEAGKLGSPQGLVLDRTGAFLYVADYIGGLYRVAIQDGSYIKMTVAESITDYGIDGLYRHDNELIVIQNGVRPHRVAALQLSENGLAINSGRMLASNLEEFDEPTLGVVRGDDFYFVANSHWNRFDRENNLPEGLTGPIVLKLSLD